MFIKKHTSLVKIYGYLMIMIAFMLTSQVFGQQLPELPASQIPEYSDDELISFIKATQQVMPLQQESQMKMIEKIEDENLTVEKFNNIMETQSKGEKSDATEEELEAFNKSIEEIQEIQYEYQPIIIKAVEDAGISPAKYDEITNNYQRDPELQVRINVLLEEMADE
jgi:DNA repair ATPase RecN